MYITQGWDGKSWSSAIISINDKTLYVILTLNFNYSYVKHNRYPLLINEYKKTRIWKKILISYMNLTLHLYFYLFLFFLFKLGTR